ncbi:hypothetical protein O6H91_08G082600 [Diphasiastrum complanatum]|uniref:Uncharacterized protein n=4 Tax=Diphasiastrum complanatum TaxID=34168 RepID=A0ACC2D0D7_DIPCM|nr:hypothetical protein O6H91_08G082300 [Diphasiastrum complanatum]KAJ7547357.1 hypothetical protein O6H91_08G082300 [Diphasiastrum complanatum]KAJ7547367.1 hypothetical protein O6H91_08G082600 [Diphasiastrum complanatum]KAJ7547368.1 hypothetical protein O6H91_08G082600 [Diphasiastrum complanatum]
MEVQSSDKSLKHQNFINSFSIKDEPVVGNYNKLHHSLDLVHSEFVDKEKLPGPAQQYASLFQKAAAEMISTFILVFVGCGAAMVDTETHGKITGNGVAATFGLLVLMMIYSVGHISGAHMNPAVTFAFASLQQIPWVQVPVYIFSQLAASICASLALKELLKPVELVGITHPAGGIVRSLVLEILLTYILMFVITSVSNNPSVGDLSGLVVACTIAVNSIFGGPVSGASMNPARSIGPAIASNSYTGIWIYILGPALGALGGAWSFKLLNPGAQKTQKLVRDG